MASIIQDYIDEKIETHGHAVIGVPGFAYTIGNALKGLPELLLLGPFNPQIVCGILNDLSEHMREKGSPLPVGLCSLSGYSHAFLVRLAGQKAKDEYTIQASAFYDHEDYKVLQILLCDRAGRYPDDEDCDPIFRVELL